MKIYDLQLSATRINLTQAKEAKPKRNLYYMFPFIKIKTKKQKTKLYCLCMHV